MRLILTFIFAFLIGFYNAQCNNGSNYYPSSTYTPTADVWGSATTINYAGEVVKINVTNGDTYQFSTCAVYGGVSASYDTQLTLRGPSGLVLAYNDDAIGCFTQSYINWTATISGEVYLHLNLYNCKTNSTSTEVRIYRTSPGGSSSEYVEVGDVVNAFITACLLVEDLDKDFYEVNRDSVVKDLHKINSKQNIFSS